MGLIGAFKYIGRAVGKGLLKGGRLISKIDDISEVTAVVAMIPVAGPVLAAAARRCNMAEKLFATKMGDQKRQWVRGQLRKDLLRLRVEEKYLDELVSVGLLVVMRHAAVRDLEEAGPKEKTKPAVVNGPEKGPGAAGDDHGEWPPPGGEQPPT